MGTKGLAKIIADREQCDSKLTHSYLYWYVWHIIAAIINKQPNEGNEILQIQYLDHKKNGNKKHMNLDGLIKGIGQTDNNLLR
jgi:hypothetical protein